MDINDSTQQFFDEDDKLIITPPSAQEIRTHRIEKAYTKLDEVIADIEYMEIVHLAKAEDSLDKLRANEPSSARDSMIRMAEDKIERIQSEIKRLETKRNHIVQKIEHLEEDEPKNRCVECGVDMGIDNPRQYCGKTQCDAL